MTDQDHAVDRPGQPKANLWQNSVRTMEFWRRCGGIYLAYKAAQTKQIFLKRRGWTSEELQQRLWRPHHAWAGREMYAICIDLRGFYLKVPSPGKYSLEEAESMFSPVARGCHGDNACCALAHGQMLHACPSIMHCMHHLIASMERGLKGTRSSRQGIRHLGAQHGNGRVTVQGSCTTKHLASWLNTLQEYPRVRGPG